MTRNRDAASAITLLVLLTAAASLPHPATPESLNTDVHLDDPHTDTPPGPLVPGNRERGHQDRQSMSKEEVEEEEELFKDVDPKKLAAVLLEALNRSQSRSRRVEDERGGMEEETETVQKQEAYREVSAISREDRDRDGRRELELLLAAHGKDKEREEEEERKKAQEEEERMTEKVTSHTTSQVVQALTERQSVGLNGEDEARQGAAPQQGSTRPDQGSSEQEEEQLNPEELKSLETMMKEFPRLNTATKREGHSEPNQRESRGYSSYNDVIPINKVGDFATSKNKLKWQEETQKALHFPTFRGGNYMDDFEDRNDVGNAARPQPQAEQVEMEQDKPEEEGEEEEGEEEEELLSPEEEEVRAKAEQEEMRRQAAEAQRAKMEEEKLADIASDMLLHYMVKQGNGNKKYSSPLSNAMEDKRSDEEQEVTGEDDIDPQTIDKLIEISSKLHLPADDVVDIISDVEKKKKKDVQPEMTSRWQRPQTLLPSSFSSASQISANQNKPPAPMLSAPTVNILKSWFQEKAPTKSENLWSKPLKPLPASQDLWPKPQKPLSVQPNPWPKSLESLLTGYSPYPYTYPSYYRRRPYSYYPIYFSPPPRPPPRFYLSKPALTASNFLGNSVDDTYPFPPKRRYQSWVQPRLRKPPLGLQQKSFYATYPYPLYPRTFQPFPIPKPWSTSQIPKYPSQHRSLYYPAHAVSKNSNYYGTEKQSDTSNHGDLKKYIQQILMKRPQILD